MCLCQVHWPWGLDPNKSAWRPSEDRISQCSAGHNAPWMWCIRKNAWILGGCASWWTLEDFVSMHGSNLSPGILVHTKGSVAALMHLSPSMIGDILAKRSHRLRNAMVTIREPFNWVTQLHNWIIRAYVTGIIWDLFPLCEMGVSKNNGTPKSSILIGFSIIFTIHFGVPWFLETPKSLPRWSMPFFLLQLEFVEPRGWYLPESRRVRSDAHVLQDSPKEKRLGHFTKLNHFSATKIRGNH